MTKKTTWQELIVKTKTDEILDGHVDATAEEIDTLYLNKFGVDSKISALIQYMNGSYFATGDDLSNNPWKDLPIFISSYAENDQRLYYQLSQKINDYLAFYKKIITDDGLALKMTIQRYYASTGSSSNTNKNIESETPSIALDNFDQGIAYASNLSKQTNDSEDSASGNSTDTHTKKTWDEEMKNMRLLFYNELVDYIANLPELIYNHYCLDSTPWWEIVKRSREYIRHAFEMR